MGRISMIYVNVCVYHGIYIYIYIYIYAAFAPVQTSLLVNEPIDLKVHAGLRVLASLLHLFTIFATIVLVSSTTV
jgi:hypothetical protein